MQNRTPRHGDIYRDRKRRVWVFVRTENRPGRSVETDAGPQDPEHLFVVVHEDKSVHAFRWFRADEPLPGELTPEVNAGAEVRIAELEARVVELEAERSALASAMKQAVGALPPAVAAHLRETYRQTRGQLLTKRG